MSRFKIIKTPIEHLIALETLRMQDDRGFLSRLFCSKEMRSLGWADQLVQINLTKTLSKGTIRGFHFQNPPYAQGKLVRVISGSVLDVAVDIRKKSPTYGQHFSIELTEQNKTMLWIPPGFAHGFATLENNTIFSYKCTNLYNKESEKCIFWNDQNLNIDWQ